MEVVVEGPMEEAEEHVHLGAEEVVKAAVHLCQLQVEEGEEYRRCHLYGRSVIRPFQNCVVDSLR